MSTTDPTETPNVVIENPSVRKGLNIAVSTTLVLVGAAATADALSNDFDISRFTVPAMGVLMYVAAAFNLAVTLPNVPRR